MSVLQTLSDSRISFAIQSLFGRGFTVSLGDPDNGFEDETTCRTWQEVEPWLVAAVIRYFPRSEAARKFAGTSPRAHH